MFGYILAAICALIVLILTIGALFGGKQVAPSPPRRLPSARRSQPAADEPAHGRSRPARARQAVRPKTPSG